MVRVCRGVLLLVVALIAASCNPFDRTQVPVVTVGKGLRPEISWVPSPAYTLTVYEGPKDGDGFGAAWSASGSGGYANLLNSPVTYGVPPANSEVAAAPPLQEGKTYTVVVVRKDEKGTGEGFSNTRNRYAGTLTFVASK